MRVYVGQKVASVQYFVCVNISWKMSHYAKTLSPETQKRYYDKLKCLGFTNVEENDSYLPDISTKSGKTGASKPGPIEYL